MQCRCMVREDADEGGCICVHMQILYIRGNASQNFQEKSHHVIPSKYLCMFFGENKQTKTHQKQQPN